MQAMPRLAARAAVLVIPGNGLVKGSPTANWENVPVIHSAPVSQSQGKLPHAAEDGGDPLKLKALASKYRPKRMRRSEMTWSGVLQ